jgi:pilus assembly protein CpaF
VHANTAADVAPRLEALAALAGLDRAALAAQAASAVDAVVHLRRRGPHRLVTEVGVVVRGGDGGLQVLPALVAGPDDAGLDDSGPAVGPGRAGPGWARLAARLALPAAWPPAAP